MKKFRKKIFKSTKGITLIALVVTIIILLILAGVSIAMLAGNNGVLTQGKRAKEETEISTLKEEAELVKLGLNIDYLSNRADSEKLKKNVLLSVLNDHFKNSKLQSNRIVTSDGKYDIIVRNNLDIVVVKHGGNYLKDGEIELSYYYDETDTEESVLVEIYPEIGGLKTYQEYAEEILGESTDKGKLFVEADKYYKGDRLPEEGKAIIEFKEYMEYLATLGVFEEGTEIPTTIEEFLNYMNGGKDIPEEKKRFHNVDEMLIAMKYVKPAEYDKESYKEITITCSNGQTSLTNTIDLYTSFRITENGTYRFTATSTDEAIGEVEIKIDNIFPKFSTNYGRIEVIWLDTTNKVIPKPNAPLLNGLTPVKWETKENTVGEEITTTNSDPEWYNYTAKTGTEDNLKSHWANAKNSDGSYFVWIPRYAYRIIYYASETSSVITGYCDGEGIKDARGKVKYSLDEGVETVLKDDIKYIVHPAFETNVNLGGWDSDLSGIWVAKYEISMEKNGIPESTDTKGGLVVSDILTDESVKAVSKPSVESWKHISIGKCYTNSRNYDTNKNSHLMKNSEWGAVAYLTHSQYGRNGHEIDINNSRSSITGNGGGSIIANPVSGMANEYNTKVGAKASSTGNIYGIYDLSGGLSEYVAAFNDTVTSSNELKNGDSFAATTNSSDKWATKYSNIYYTETAKTASATGQGEKIYEIGKIGDATKEVWKNTSNTNGYNWFDDGSRFLNAISPFFKRGEDYSSASYKTPGVFSSSYESGSGSPYTGFRICLAF